MQDFFEKQLSKNNNCIQIDGQCNLEFAMWPMPASKILLETSIDTYHVWLWSFHDWFLPPTYFPPNLHLLEETLQTKQSEVFGQLWNWHLKTPPRRKSCLFKYVVYIYILFLYISIYYIMKSYDTQLCASRHFPQSFGKKTKVPCLVMASCNSWNLFRTSTGVSAPWWMNGVFEGGQCMIISCQNLYKLSYIFDIFIAYISCTTSTYFFHRGTLLGPLKPGISSLVGLLIIIILSGTSM